MDTDNEAKTLINASLAGKLIEIPFGAYPATIVPNGYHIQELDNLLPEPVRTCKAIQFSRVESFVRYIRKNDVGTSQLFLKEGEHRFTVCFDAATSVSPSRETHTAGLSLKMTESFRKWSGVNGKWQKQSEFAHFIEMAEGDVMDPTSAEMLEIAKTLEVTKNSAFKSSVRLDNGDMEFRWAEATDNARAGKGGNLVIPTEIKLGITPFKGVDPFIIRAKLRYRAKEDGLYFCVEMMQLEDLLEKSLSEICQQIEVETNLKAFWQ